MATLSAAESGVAADFNLAKMSELALKMVTYCQNADDDHDAGGWKRLVLQRQI